MIHLATLASGHFPSYPARWLPHKLDQKEVLGDCKQTMQNAIARLLSIKLSCIYCISYLTVDLADPSNPSAWLGQPTWALSRAARAKAESESRTSPRQSHAELNLPDMTDVRLNVTDSA